MNIFRYYNQNRKMIWLVIGAIVILIIALQAINGIIKIQNENRELNNTINEKEYKNNLNINVLISEENIKEDEKLIIDQFLRYCNARKVEEAYSLLTNNCKEQLFPNIEYFKKNYYNIHFVTTKLYSKEQFIGNTYKIKLYDDILSTGSINSNSVEDYYTIEKQGNEVKLNICNYIGDIEINKSKTDENIQIKVIKKQVYKEYEQYELEVTNLTYKTILLDSKENTKTMYLTGENNVKYYCLSHEMLLENLIINPKSTKKVFLKYSKEYNSNRTLKNLIFSDIILDYEVYKTNKKKDEYTEKSTIIVDIYKI